MGLEASYCYKAMAFKEGCILNNCHVINRQICFNKGDIVKWERALSSYHMILVVYSPDRRREPYLCFLVSRVMLDYLEYLSFGTCSTVCRTFRYVLNNYVERLGSESAYEVCTNDIHI